MKPERVVVDTPVWSALSRHATQQAEREDRGGEDAFHEDVLVEADLLAGGAAHRREQIAQRDDELLHAAQDRLRHAARQPAFRVDQKRVGPVLVEADRLRHRSREKREPAGDEAGVGAVRAHGAHQRARAGREGDALGDDGRDHRGVETREQRHPLAQGRLGG